MSPDTSRRALPGPRELLQATLAGRVLLVGIALALALRSGSADGVVSTWLLAAGAVSSIVAAELFWWLRRSVVEPSPARLAVQAVTDVALAAVVVHALPLTPVAAANVLVVALYATLLPLPGGLAVTALVTGIHLADGLATYPDGARRAAVWAQAAILNVVFASVALLAARLRAARSEQATLERELDRLRLEASDILTHIHSGIVTVDGDGRLVFANPTAERLLQINAGALAGEPVLDLLKDRSAELWGAIMHGIRGGPKVGRGEGRVRHADGRMFPIGLSTTTFRTGPDASPSVTAIFTDISDSKLLGELHLRAERLGAVAELSASLAHEIRNPLASIRSSVEQLARSAAAGEDEQILAKLIVRESERLSRLLGEFLDFSRVRKTKAEPFDLAELAKTVIVLVRSHPDVGEDVTIVDETQPAVLEGDEDLLHRVIQNLVLNAAQAATGPTTIRVRTSVVHSDVLPEGAGIETAAVLEVADDGPGIPEEIRTRLFEPFVSRRAGGSGLGLAIVQRAVEAHRGLVFVDTAEGRGTRFTIYLPIRWTSEQTA